MSANEVFKCCIHLLNSIPIKYKMNDENTIYIYSKTDELTKKTDLDVNQFIEMLSKDTGCFIRPEVDQKNIYDVFQNVNTSILNSYFKNEGKYRALFKIVIVLNKL